MKIIQEMTDNIMEEVADAKKYAKLALHYKDEEPEVAETFYGLSREEIDHMNKLHARVVILIQKYRKEHGEPPESMLAVYDYLHDKYMECAAEVKRYQSLYNA